MRDLNSAVVMDDWKLPYYKRELDGAHFEYSENPGPMPETITLSVSFEQFRMETLVRTLRLAEVNAQAARRQSGGKH